MLHGVLTQGSSRHCGTRKGEVRLLGGATAIMPTGVAVDLRGAVARKGSHAGRQERPQREALQPEQTPIRSIEEGGPLSEVGRFKSMTGHRLSQQPCNHKYLSMSRPLLQTRRLMMK
jgi:hypothetical protein